MVARTMACLASCWSIACASSVGVQQPQGLGGEGGAAGGASTVGASAAGGSSSTGPDGCRGDSDCTASPKGPACIPSTGECVECVTDEHCADTPEIPACDVRLHACVGCVPVRDAAVDCGIGAYCDPGDLVCVQGCSGDADCPSPEAPFCVPDTKQCAECVDDSACPAGEICVLDQCIPGCNGTHPCVPGLSCCGQACFDLGTDPTRCGSCFIECSNVDHAVTVCITGLCTLGPCDAGYANCNWSSVDGCEVNTLVDGACVCLPGEPKPCYPAPPSTQGVGECVGGASYCDENGLAYGACIGAVLPAPEICGNGKDESCDGTADDGCP